MVKFLPYLKYAAIAIGVYFLWKMIASVSASISTGVTSVLGPSPNSQAETKAILNIPISGTSKTEADLRARADSLENAMSAWGTDEDLIFTTLAGCNNNDLKAIYKYFGFRTYGDIGSTQYGNSLDLQGWFNQELSGSDLQKVRQIFAPTKLF